MFSLVKSIKQKNVQLTAKKINTFTPLFNTKLFLFQINSQHF